jgi:hypothetical protein
MLDISLVKHVGAETLTSDFLLSTDDVCDKLYTYLGHMQWSPFLNRIISTFVNFGLLASITLYCWWPDIGCLLYVLFL